MEGYLATQDYCRLTGISKDTALHRAIRGTIPAFKDKDGRWFIYYKGEERQILPEGYITPREYAKRNNVRFYAIRDALTHKKFRQEDLKVVYNKGYWGKEWSTVLIREDTECPPDIPRFYGNQRVNTLIDRNAPEGYISLNTYCIIHDIPGNKKWKVYKKLRESKLEGIMIEGHWYIKDADIHT